MSKRSFRAGQWLLSDTKAETKNNSAQESSLQKERPRASAPKSESNSTIPANVRAALAPFVPKSEQSDEGMNKFFIPGWKGESLTSKRVKKFNELLDIFHQEAIDAFLRHSNFNRRLESAIYDEFMAYAEFKTCVCSDLDDYTVFWKEARSPDSQYREILDEFIEIFCFRVAVIFVLKLRFLSVLMEQSNLKFDSKKLAYPNSLLTTIFQKGGRNELNSKALEQNIFSWFRPSENGQKKLVELKDLANQLTVTEIIKNISLKSEKLLGAAEYSHALSHKNFGLFLNSLLINFPLWSSIQNTKKFNGFKKTFQDMEILSCKFCGDYLESLALSHWLAQDANKEVHWDQILCPDFKGMDFEAGLYWKIFNELQFLTFLAQIANTKGKEPISFVSQVASGHLKNRKQSGQLQKSLLPNDFGLNHSTYDRVILNLNEYPKNNSQHFLISNIQQQEPFLKEGGTIYAISSKKLFVPSQKAKVEALLTTFKIEAMIQLEEVKGKGEVGSYIYVFSKRSSSSPKTAKQTCFTFRLSSNLNSFQDYSKLTHLIQDFFIDNLGDAPPLYSKEFNGAKIEFFQDAIVKGRLIHSGGKDSNRITHPSFFRNLLASCQPLDYFLHLQQISFNGQNNKTEDPLFEYSGATSETEAPYVLVVDKRNKEKTNIEIINSNALEAKSFEYGHSMCFYFGALPKWPSISIDCLRDFFSSPVGEQIIELTFSGDLRNIKANLNKVLAPKIFAQPRPLPEHIAKGLSVLSLKSDDLLEMRPSSIKEGFDNCERLLYEVAKNYPGEVMAKLSRFKRSVKKSLDIFGGGGVNFNNPIIKTPLVLSKTQKIYPNNEEVYVEFNNENSLNLIHSPLEKVKRKTNNQNGIETFSLELHAAQSVFLTIYADEDMILFLKFIFENLTGVPLSKLLQGVAAPRLQDLKSIIASFKSLKTALEELNYRLPQIYATLINQSINQSQK